MSDNTDTFEETMSDNTDTFDLPEGFDLDAALAEQAKLEKELKEKRAFLKKATEKRKAEQLAILTPYLDSAKAVKNAFDESEPVKAIEKYKALLADAKSEADLLWNGDENTLGVKDDLDDIVAKCSKEHGEKMATVLRNAIDGKKKSRKPNGSGNGGSRGRTTGIEEAAGFTSPCGNVTINEDGFPLVNGDKVTWAAACAAVTDLCGMLAAEDSDHPKDQGRTGLAIKGNSAKRQFESYMNKAQA